MAGTLAFMFLFQLVMLPYTAFTFNYVSVSAFLINIPVIAIAGIMVPAGAAMMLITYLFQGPVCRVLGMLFYGCAEILTGINDAAYRPGMLSFDAVSPKLWMILLFYGAFFTAASELFLIMKIRKRWHEILCIAAVVAVISAGAGRLADDPFRDAELVFVDVGQGDCMHLRVREGNVLTGGERNYLFDGGGNVRYDLGKKVLKQYLLKNGVARVNGAFVTHLHTDHYKGICELARQGMIDRLFVYDGNRIREEEICKETGLDAGRITYLSAGQTVKAGEKTQVRVLWPLKKTEAEYTDMAADKEDENASSLIMQVTVDGVSVLVTGDLGEEGEEQLLAAGIVPDSDILKVGHHGSKTSSTDSFLDRVSPVMAVIQVGKNNIYGHPSPETIKRLEERKIPILRTDLDGAVMVDAEDGRITDVRTVIRKAQ